MPPTTSLSGIQFSILNVFDPKGPEKYKAVAIWLDLLIYFYAPNLRVVGGI